jgi:hypothetical protein
VAVWVNGPSIHEYVSGPETMTIKSVGTAMTDGVAAVAPAAAEVDVVDFGARPGAIFYVPSDDGVTMTAVVWLADDEPGATSGGR